VKQIDYQDIYDSELAKGCITHTHLPFLKDYITLHILLKKYQPLSVLEIGTHVGEGTNIICNAVPGAKVYSLDLPPTEAYKTLQHPSLKNILVGAFCLKPYTQLFGDSFEFPYQYYEAWFIDGEHDYYHPRHETIEAIKSKAKLIIWHDADIIEVNNAITDSFEWNKDYHLYRVTGTRITYAIKL